MRAMNSDVPTIDRRSILSGVAAATASTAVVGASSPALAEASEPSADLIDLCNDCIDAGNEFYVAQFDCRACEQEAQTRLEEIVVSQGLLKPKGVRPKEPGLKGELTERFALRILSRRTGQQETVEAECGVPEARAKEETCLAGFNHLWRKISEYPANTIGDLAVKISISDALIEVNPRQPLISSSQLVPRLMTDITRLGLDPREGERS